VPCITSVPQIWRVARRHCALYKFLHLLTYVRAMLYCYQVDRELCRRLTRCSGQWDSRIRTLVLHQLLTLQVPDLPPAPLLLLPLVLHTLFKAWFRQSRRV